MKKLFATLMLLMCVSLAFAGKSGDVNGAIDGGGKQSVCHDKNGNWSPQDKNCDLSSCGCLFHEIEHFILDLFE